MANIKRVGNLAHFAIADAVDSSGDLLCHNLADRRDKPGLESRLIKLPAMFPCLEKSEEIRRSRQAADMGRKNAVGAESHGVPALMVETRKVSRTISTC